MLTPNVRLVKSAVQETIVGDKPFSAFGVEVALYLPYEQGNYAPFDRFSDSGTDIYLEFFAGDAHQGNLSRPLALKMQLTGLPGETVIPPDARNPLEPDYAYFGPARPEPFGAARVIVDPHTPAWLIPVIQETTGRITSYCEAAFQRKFTTTPLFLLSMETLSSHGISIKGGTFDHKIVYRFGGEALTHE